MQQRSEGAGVGVFEPALDAIEEGGRGGHALEALGEGLNRGERLVVILGPVFVALLDVDDGIGQELSFDQFEAIEAPPGGDHFADQVVLDGAVGTELLVVGIEQALVIGGVFARENQGLGCEAVADRVLRRALFAGVGFGAAGFCAIGARGLGFCLRSHWNHLGGSG
ncbi:MAG TPA: hypothetical protein VF146_18450 [Bryobacteraceae bacterium]